MHRIRQSALVGAVTLVIACGGGGGGGATDPNGNGNNNGSSSKVVTATINGTPFAATLVSGAFLNGALTINGVNGLKSVHINAINVSGPGTIALNKGNQWSALGEFIDGNSGTFSTGYGGTGSVVLTIASLGHVKGSYSFTAYTSAGTGLGMPVVTVGSGVFDITVP